MSRKRKLQKQLSSIEWDYVAEDAPKCPACGSAWQDAPAVYVSVEMGIAMVDNVPFYVNDEQARILQVLRASCSRWVTLSELVSLAYSDLPDCDAPVEYASIETALRLLKRRLTTCGYQVESRRNFGYRLRKNGKTK